MNRELPSPKKAGVAALLAVTVIETTVVAGLVSFNHWHAARQREPQSGQIDQRDKPKKPDRSASASAAPIDAGIGWSRLA